jgi:hypothetical protein
MNREEYGLLYLFLITLRIIITIYCVNRARKLNRNIWGWGIFGFILPLVALIWIQFMKPRLLWYKNPDLYSKEPHGDGTKPYVPYIDRYDILEIRFWIGIVAISIIMLIDRYVPKIEFGDLWPLILMTIGIGLIIRRNKYK